MNIKQIVDESVLSARRDYVQTAVNKLLGEDIVPGQTVAVVDDPISGMSGMKGIVKSISASNTGFAEVASENGTLIRMQTSLLVPVGKI